jgi:hypothetical protein
MTSTVTRSPVTLTTAVCAASYGLGTVGQSKR